MEALETVKDPKYAEIRTACIDALRESIEEHSKLIKGAQLGAR